MAYGLGFAFSLATWRSASSPLARGSSDDGLSFRRILVVSVLGPCRLLAGSPLHGPERGGRLDGESTLSGDGLVCSGPRGTVASLGGLAPVLLSSLGCSVLGLASPACLSRLVLG